MTEKVVIYCSANFTRIEGGVPMALAMVLPDGRWQYAEVIDFDPAACDDQAREVFMPLMRRIPGTRFVKAADLARLVSEFIESLSLPIDDEIEIRVFRSSPALAEILAEASKISGRAMQIKPMAVNRTRYADFQRHCGGAEKTEGHALMESVGAALCQLSGDVPTAFHESPIYHLELLLGSKNATSYRAWARTQERGAAKVISAGGCVNV